MSIEMFTIRYKPSAYSPAVRLLCQSVNLDGEKMLWVDGLDVADPMMLPISAAQDIEWAGSFREIMTARIDLAEQVIAEAQGEYSPTIMVRAVQFMAHDRTLTAEEALDLSAEQAADLIDSDNFSARAFTPYAQMAQMASLPIAAPA